MQDVGSVINVADFSTIPLFKGDSVSPNSSLCDFKPDTRKLCLRSTIFGGSRQCSDEDLLYLLSLGCL